MIVDIVLLTFPNHPKRLEYLGHTWDCLQKYMVASGDTIRYLCVSESERDPACPWCGDELEQFCHERDIPLTWLSGPASLGHGMNGAMRTAQSAIFGLHQDDYELKHPLDLSLGIRMMERHAEVDLIRYGYPPPEFKWRHLDYKDGWKRFDLTAHWPYGDEPRLQRKTFPTKFGWYTENNGHASEGTMLWTLVRRNAVILAADKRYYDHYGTVSAVPANKEMMGRISQR